jgi:uncharacterized damage-inducible protein DinB
MRPLVAHCHLGLGKLYRRTGKRQEAREHLRIAATMYREMGMRFWPEKAGRGDTTAILTRRWDMTTGAAENPGETQARRLERVYEEVARLLRDPGVASRLRSAPGKDAWSAMQTLGHMTEMIPYWLNHCRILIAATGTAPTFGRSAGSPERLAGVAHGATASPDALLRRLEEEVQAAADTIRTLSMAERSKRGISSERGEMTVAEVLESFIVSHAEEHLAQVQAALRSDR